jgi:hypothetical protein
VNKLILNYWDFVLYSLNQYHQHFLLSHIIKESIITSCHLPKTMSLCQFNKRKGPLAIRDVIEGVWHIPSIFALKGFISNDNNDTGVHDTLFQTEVD